MNALSSFAFCINRYESDGPRFLTYSEASGTTGRFLCQVG